MIRIAKIEDEKQPWMLNYPPDEYQFVAWERLDRTDMTLVDMLFPCAKQAFLTSGAAGEIGIPDVDPEIEVRVLWFNVYEE